MSARGTDETREGLAELLGEPAEDVLHYVVVLRTRGTGMAFRFCGMPQDAMALLGLGVAALAANEADLEAAKLASGCTRCGEV